MRHINGVYTQRFNRRHKKDGQDAFKNWIKEKFKDLRFQHDVPESKELALSGKVVRELVCRAFKVENDVLIGN